MVRDTLTGRLAPHQMDSIDVRCLPLGVGQEFHGQYHFAIHFDSDHCFGGEELMFCHTGAATRQFQRIASGPADPAAETADLTR